MSKHHFAAAVLIVFLITTYSLHQLRPLPVDYLLYQAASSELLRKGLYVPERLVQFIDWTKSPWEWGTAQQFGVYGSPSILVFFFPFSVVTEPYGHQLYLLATLIAVAAIAWMSERLAFGSRSISWTSAALFIPAGALADGLHVGAPSWMSALGIVGYLYLRQQGSLFSGLMLSLTVIKLHWAAPFVAFVVGYSASHRDWKSLCGLLCGVFAPVSLIEWLAPRTFSVYWDSLSRSDALSWINATIPNLVTQLWVQRSLLTLLGPSILLSAILFIVGLKTKTGDLNLRSALLLPLCILFAPYAWGHDYIVLSYCIAQVLGSSAELRLSTLQLRFGCLQVIALLFGLAHIIPAEFHLFPNVGVFAIVASQLKGSARK